jgi:hypothetical protein
VVKKVSFSMAGKRSGKKKSVFIMAGKGYGYEVNFSMAGKRSDKQSQFTSWLERGMVKKSISAWLEVAPGKNILFR